jgi:hypothetical protein
MSEKKVKNYEGEPLIKLYNRVTDIVDSREKYFLGRVLTIIDSAISDPEQRKATKDLVNNAFYNERFSGSINVEFRLYAKAKDQTYYEELPQTVAAIDVYNPYEDN